VVASVTTRLTSCTCREPGRLSRPPASCSRGEAVVSAATPTEVRLRGVDITDAICGA